MHTVKLRLDQAHLGQTYRVVSIDCAYPGQEHYFYDIGIVAGELITVKIQGLFEMSNRVVMIGNSLFALRKDECKCIVIEPVYGSQ